MWLFKSERFLFCMMGALALWALGAAVFFEYYDHLAPCMLCIMQRVLFLSIFFVAAFGFLISKASFILRRIASVLIFIISLMGMSVVARQLWIASLPEAQRPLCLPSVEYIFNNFLWNEILPLFFIGTGDCAEISWKFLGLSMPAWSLVFFAAISVGSIFLLFVSTKKKGG